MVRVLATLFRPDAGHAEVLGHDVVKGANEVRKRIAFTGQFAAVDEILTGRENLRMFGRLMHLRRDEVRPRADELLERFDLSHAADRPAKTYSGGMRRRLELAKINPEAPLDRACLFACGLSTGLGAAMNTAKVEAGSTCAVFGAVAGRQLRGAERIIAIDLSEERLELARGQGATDTMAGGPATVERILEETDGFGADYTFEATGNVGVMQQAVEVARMGWGLCTVAGVAGRGETLDVVPRLLITGRRVAGSSFGGVKGRDGVPKFIESYMAGDIDVDPFISH